MNLNNFLIETGNVENLIAKVQGHKNKKAIDEEFYQYHNIHIDQLTREKITPEQRTTLKQVLKKHS